MIYISYDEETFILRTEILKRNLTTVLELVTVLITVQISL